jgi:hypothetical protein
VRKYKNADGTQINRWPYSRKTWSRRGIISRSTMKSARMGTFAEIAIVDQGIQTSISICSKHTEVCRFRFSVCSKQIYLYIYRYICIYICVSICLYIYKYVHTVYVRLATSKIQKLPADFVIRNVTNVCTYIYIYRSAIREQ